jgi:DNA replicative helicase MCM subunit Mcm2 (Cdc46/Mcm family)
MPKQQSLLLFGILFFKNSQLEAIIRISESLAKMTLSHHATERHVDEAIRLFNASTMNAIQSGVGSISF